MSHPRTDLRSQRLKLRLAQRELAERAGIDHRALRLWEKGLEMPDRSSAAKLAAQLSCDAATLMRDQRKHAETSTTGEGYLEPRQDGVTILKRRKEVPRGARRVLDLFCGSGGLSKGFDDTGEFTTTCGIDLLSDRVETFSANHPHADGIIGDLRAFPLGGLADHAGEVDVMVGGPPCQGFSSVRPYRNLNENDARNTLAEQYILALKTLRPSWFVLENVVGILRHKGGASLDRIIESARAAGYSCEWKVINAANLGVPQNRERVIVVGNRLGVEFRWPEVTHLSKHRSMAGPLGRHHGEAPLFSSRLRDAVTLEEAIGDLPEVESGAEVSAYDSKPMNSYQQRMRGACRKLTMHKATKHSAKMLEIIRHSGDNIHALPEGLVRSGFSSCYSRLRPDHPCNTLTVNFVHPASNRCIHPSQDRALTPREGARIQSFPDDFVFSGTSVQVVKQIGNAVPPFLGRAIAEGVLDSK